MTGHNLGRWVDAYRTHRPAPVLLLWLSAAVAAVLALVAFVLDVDWLGYVLVPLAVLGVLAYARLVPPRGGRRTLTVYEQGFVEASAAGSRAVHWSDVESVTAEPDPAGGMTIVYDTGDPAEPGRIDVDAAGRRRLLHLVEAGVRWQAIQRARAELRDQGKTAFGPVVITPAGLELDATDQRLPWERLARVLIDEDRLVVSTTDSSGLLVAWFDGPVPHASACAPFVNEVNPKVQRPATMQPAAYDRAEAHPLRKHLVGLAVLALVVPIGYASYARLFLPERRSGSPTAGLADGACDARRVAYRATARYQGAGPHPIVAYSDVPNQPAVEASFPAVPAEWRPQTPALTQLIACVRVDLATTARMSVIQTCHGEDLFGGGFKSTLTFYQAGYQIDIYEARTGKTVGTTHLQPATVDCPDRWRTYRNGESVQVPVLPTAADYREALRQFVA